MAFVVPAFSIRPYEPQDLPGIRNVILPIQQNEFGVLVTWEAQPDLHEIPPFYRRGAGDFWVAVTDGTIIGTIALIDIGNDHGVIRKMFVDADWRGKEHGAAQALLEILIDHAKSRGIEYLSLGTTEKFLAAHRFYERNGFLAIDVTQLPDHFPRMAVDTRFYQLALET